MSTGPRSTRAIADPDRIIWVRPQTVKFKIAGSREFKIGLAGVLPGDWDLQRQEIEGTEKFRSIVQHFTEGKVWEETELFSIYADRFRRGEVVRGCRNMDQLKKSYLQVDQIFSRLKTEGFRLPQRGKDSLPHVHIARDGEILFGRGGNHRFAMARILKLENFPCVVHARHERWQETRDKIFALSRPPLQKLHYPTLVDHPDLADILPSEIHSTRILQRAIEMVRGWYSQTR